VCFNGHSFYYRYPSETYSLSISNKYLARQNEVCTLWGMVHDKLNSVEIIEVGPRDGLQNEPVILTWITKAELISRLADCGASRIEAVSFVNPKAVPTMAHPGNVLRAARDKMSTASLAALVLNRRGAADAIAEKCDEVNLVAVASDTFNRRNQGVLRKETLAQAVDMVVDLQSAGIKTTLTIAAAFGCPFEGEIDEGVVLQIAALAAGMGVNEIAIADTIGVASPRRVANLFRSIEKECPGVPLRAHFHDTRSAGLANARAALDAGVSRLDASIGGFGGCPFAPKATGNIATEDLAFMLERDGIATNLDIDALCRTAEWLGKKLSKPVPSGVANSDHFPPKPFLPAGSALTLEPNA
jgi:hydroxymethylglutaryl-CoA lyase